MGKSSVDSQIREGEEEEEDTQKKKKEKNIRDEEQESKAPKLVEHFARYNIRTHAHTRTHTRNAVVTYCDESTQK